MKDSLFTVKEKDCEVGDFISIKDHQRPVTLRIVGIGYQYALIRVDGYSWGEEYPTIELLISEEVTADGYSIIDHIKSKDVEIRRIQNV